MKQEINVMKVKNEINIKYERKLYWEAMDIFCVSHTVAIKQWG